MSLIQIELFFLAITVATGFISIVTRISEIKLKTDVMWNYWTNHQGHKDLKAMLEDKQNGR